jgi:hypothetical protein
VLYHRVCTKDIHREVQKDKEGSKETVKEGSKETVDEKTKVVVDEKTKTTLNYTRPNWNVGASVFLQTNDPISVNALKYGFKLERRIFWELYIGVTGIPQAHLYGVSASMSF